jgi:formyl-CoA transferase
MTTHRASSALSRFRVIDLTRARSGPACARQLADWGADVIKVELPPAVYESRDFATRDDPDFLNLHRNKRSLTLDLKRPEGVAILKRLVEKADVLIENYRPDVKARLGIDYESLRAINPRLVYASISGFGQDGPYAGRPGVDQIAQGMGGLMSITGEPGRGPMRVGIAISDMASGILAASGILTALLEREVSGEGQWVTTSLLESQIFMNDFQAAKWLIRGEVPGQAGNDHPSCVPMGCFRTADGHVNIAPMPVDWAKFCRLLGLDALIDHPDYRSVKLRVRNRDAVNGAVEAVTTQHPSAHWIALMNKAAIPCGPVYAMDQCFADEQVRQLGIVQSAETADGGRIDMIGQPFHLSRTDSRIAGGPPGCGEHNDEILDSLGYSAEEITHLRERNII